MIYIQYDLTVEPCKHSTLITAKYGQTTIHYCEDCGKEIEQNLDDPLDKALKEIERLTLCLHKANAQVERFERLYYLRGNALENIKDHCQNQESALARAIVASCDYGINLKE